MSENTASLCIGGTLDGQRIIAEGARIQAAIYEPITLSAMYDPRNEPVPFKTQGYRAEPFRCGEKRYTIYVANYLSTEEAFEQLLRGYKPTPPKEHLK